MVMKVEPVVECVEAVRSQDPDPGHLVMLTPQGRRLDQPIVEELARHKRIILLCGRYEGFDERIRLILEPDEISIGDFVLNGGEVAAMTIIDATIRLVPGVLGDEDSSASDSFSGEPAVAGMCPIHAAAGVSRPRGAAGPAERQPRRNRPLERRKQPPADPAAQNGLAERLRCRVRETHHQKHAAVRFTHPTK